MKKYFNYLKSLERSYRKAHRPISMVIMAECLSYKFNLSPEYCEEIVDNYCSQK